MRQELPPREEGTRRTFRRGGYTSATDAQADLDHVRALFALPDADDDEGRVKMAELLEKVATEKAPLPDIEETRRRLRRGRRSPLSSRSASGWRPRSRAPRRRTATAATSPCT
ncbi:hypothetical protein [Streptomyces sp. NBC_01187]|uniref:hypothetical protein n=1 Tax=Streptomyces sp. NBC_01187 TaxID=2903766 RepID=UPI003867755A|nr:hypothetical protein OG220_21005 [Streptomyces sp. NBC_01187]